MSKSTKNKLKNVIENEGLEEIKSALECIKDARSAIRQIVKRLDKIGHYDEADELETVEMFELESVEYSIKILKEMVK